MNYHIHFILRTLLFYLFACQSLVSSSQSIKNALIIADSKYPVEKIHIQIHKEEFLAGENIWLKAYLFSGYSSSLISGNLYVGLYDSRRKLIDSTLIPLNGGTGQGHLQLPSNLPEGLYYLRSYTNWMRNFDSTREYVRSIPVYNAHATSRLTRRPISWTAGWFAESGDLLNGMVNGLAVRLFPTGSLPRTWTGAVFVEGNQKDTLLTFQSLNPEIAIFSFVPVSGKKYEIQLRDQDGNSQTLKLEGKNVGQTIQINRVKDRLYLNVVSNNGTAETQQLKLVCTIQNDLVFESDINTNDNKPLMRSLNVNSLPAGILRFTLFDSQERLRCERLFYLNKETPAPVSIRQAAGKDDSLDHWAIEVDTGNTKDYTISVGSKKFHERSRRTITSDFFLGDIGINDIQDPGWYFDPKNRNAVTALNALLITEKWRSFSWYQALTGASPQIKHVPEKSLSFTGQIFEFGSPLKNSSLNLLLKLKSRQNSFAQVKTDEAGRFYIKDISFFDTLSIAYRLDGKKIKNAERLEMSVTPDQHFIPWYGPLPYSEIALSGSATDIKPTPFSSLISDNKTQFSKQLQEVIVRGNRVAGTEKINKEYSSQLFNSETEQRFDLLQDNEEARTYNHIIDWLDGRVAGMTFRIKTDEEINPLTESPNRANQRIPMIRGQEVSFFIDEIPTDIDAIYALPVSDIAYVKVMRGYVLGAVSGGGGSGAVIIYTRKSTGSRVVKPANSVSVTGYRPILPYGFNLSPLSRLGNNGQDHFVWLPFPLLINEKLVLPKGTAEPRVVTVSGLNNRQEPFYFEIIIGEK